MTHVIPITTGIDHNMHALRQHGRPAFQVLHNPLTKVLTMRFPSVGRTFRARPVAGLPTLLVTEDGRGNGRESIVSMVTDAVGLAVVAAAQVGNVLFRENEIDVTVLESTADALPAPAEKRDRALLAALLAGESSDFSLELDGEAEVRRFFELLEPYNCMNAMRTLPDTLAARAASFPKRVTVGNEGSLVVYATWFVMDTETMEAVCDAVKETHGADEADCVEKAVIGWRTLRFWWD